MTCPECSIAVKRTWHGFAADCQGCKARAVARMPKFASALKGGKQDHQYRQMLEQVGVSHEEVKAARHSDALRARRDQAVGL